MFLPLLVGMWHLSELKYITKEVSIGWCIAHSIWKGFKNVLLFDKVLISVKTGFPQTSVLELKPEARVGFQELILIG